MLSRVVSYPVGVGDNTVRVLVTDGRGPEPVVMATYTVSLRREDRPSLPMFGEHLVCSFLQVRAGAPAWGRGHLTGGTAAACLLPLLVGSRSF